jgi:hypothetical protein
VRLFRRIPANIKFITEQALEDGSYKSYIYPSGKLRKKGCQPILLRVIEYTIEHSENPTEQLTYRLITSLLDIEKFPAELLAREYQTCPKYKFKREKMVGVFDLSYHHDKSNRLYS